jgi:glycosyltransferase involved in cell wall biosynthesis
MEKKPKVSVCVTTYNQENYIRECLQSIVDQKTDFDFEVLVSDDCSTDGTQAIVQEFVERYPLLVRLAVNANNLGALKNFFETHNLAHGLYISHMDGDDIMLPLKLQKQVDFLDSNLDFSVVWHRMNFFDDFGGRLPGEKYDYSMFPDGIVTLEHCMRLGVVACNSAMMYRKSARKTYQYCRPMLDLFFTWEYLMSGNGKILDDTLGEYNVAAAGSIRVSSDTRSISADHAFYYLKLMPRQRANIFIFALINLLVDLKNFRFSIWIFAKLTLASASFVSPLLLIKTIIEQKKLRVPRLQYNHDIATKINS